MFAADTRFMRALVPHPQRSDGLGITTEYSEDGVRLVSRGLADETTLMGVDYKNRVLTINNTRIPCKTAPPETLVADDASVLSGPVFSVSGGHKAKAARSLPDVETTTMEYGQISRDGPHFDLNGKLYIREKSEMEKAAEDALKKAGY